MLNISRKKLTLAKLLIYAGISMMLAGVLYYPMLFIGLIFGIIGAQMKFKMYRCPKCGTSVLPKGSRINALFDNSAADFCEKCGEYIDLNFVE